MSEIETPGLATFFKVIGWIGLIIGSLVIAIGFSMAGRSPIAGAAAGMSFAAGMALIISACMMLAISAVLTYLNKIVVLTERNNATLRQLQLKEE